MKKLVIAACICFLIAGILLAQAVWQLHQARSQSVGAIAGSAGFIVFVLLGAALLVFAIIMRLRTRG